MKEFLTRRQQLMAQLGQDAIVIVPSNQEVPRNGDAHYPFRQQSDFFYLTGFNEPDAVMVLYPNGKSFDFILYNRPRDPLMETWNGRRAGQEGAVRDFGADKSFAFDDFYDHLSQLLADVNNVCYPTGHHPELDDVVMASVNELRMKVRAGTSAPTQFTDVSPLIHEMRLIKDEVEIAAMREMNQLSKEAHMLAMQTCRPGLFEYNLQAKIEYTYLNNGCSGPAYTSIVGSGANACILHYIENNQELKDGDLVLIDSGGERNNYGADITRTFPVNGKFSEPQKQLYELVLKAQMAALDIIKPGLVWNKIQAAMVDVFVGGLLELGLLKGDKKSIMENHDYRRFYMHNSGHWLGLDTHDVGSYKINGEWRQLETGMIFTVEPGLYIAAGSEGVDEKWWDIGIRIEDNILVTENGYENLTEGLPKTVAEIEGLMEANG